ncbi:DUF2809 domain-containing protein [Chitinophaga parva]|uniref:DUF2809 domain-containing protein n=1 Tax=Chitinophaga parva TaxID=2169414 RepID=A0A2T7BEU5_9BACT|nr:DUF2809 domain-containing protein [Chitinophaga parva]PUZ24807.1 DUF2809 domain-containing protein [Chitinophaga parva]
MKFRFNTRYFVLAVLLFIIEVLIARYLHDEFVRPYVGDFLVVILIYCFVCSFVQAQVFPLAVGVLIFAYLVEISQYFHLVKWLGWEHSRLANVVLGNFFTWNDMVCYTLGIGVVLLVNKLAGRW